ncbi:MAG: mandelate racemase, partial [Verrucomicrobia bacterium]|nr:mandelate racemase [Verrucomicrobiota bacterium]
MPTIQSIETRDFRKQLEAGAGSDAVHTDPQYGYGVTLLKTDNGLTGSGIAYTLGTGTNLVCDAIQILAVQLQDRNIEELMAEFGAVQRSIAEHPAVRWLGPHKGVTHLALASITNACFDLWAKARGVPLWKLLLDLSPEEIVRLIDFSYLEEEITPAEATEMLRANQRSRSEREGVLQTGYPGYDTSVGWFQYSDEQIRDNAKAAVDAGFTAMKLKVGAKDHSHDVRRAFMVREAVGNDVRIMLDANQAWSLP